MDDFWSVELGVRMGPLVLGTEYEPLLQVLRDHRIDVDRLKLESSGRLKLSEFGTQLIFSQTSPRTLDRIDVEDERLRFGSLAVIGKRVHEIIGIFKVSRKKTLWCSLEDNCQSLEPAAHESTTQSNPTQSGTTAHSRALLARGTIWIPALGLGFTLRDALIATVHLCHPAQAPRNGSGPWTKEQQWLSEVRELPPISIAPTRRDPSSILSPVIHLALVVSMAALIWWAIQLQRRWDAAIEVPAVVVAVEPPPPSPLPNDITVSFQASSGTEHRQTLGYMQFLKTPQLGDEVSVRYLPDAPDMPLGPVAARDVGFDTAVPYGIGILALYSVLQLSLFGALSLRTRRS